MLQAPEKFVAAAVRNPVCNFALMVGTTDIPNWCYLFSSIISLSFPFFLMLILKLISDRLHLDEL